MGYRFLHSLPSLTTLLPTPEWVGENTAWTVLDALVGVRNKDQQDTAVEWTISALSVVGWQGSLR